MKILSLLILVVLLLLGCQSEKPTPSPNIDLYFPPILGNEWETSSPESFNWNIQEIASLRNLLVQNDTRAFILLKSGKIVLEEYYGQTLIGGQDFGPNSLWYWASAGKTVTAALVGMAAEEGKLRIDEPSSKYLGEGWTNLSKPQEDQITIWHHLTMTTGLDDRIADLNSTKPEDLNFLAEPGKRWAYHNAPYTLLADVVENATGEPYQNYYTKRLSSTIGMTGTWQRIDQINVLFSNARSMARFGLLFLANGDWNGQSILKDKSYFQQMISTSQNLNESYGYLWWLNGKSTIMIPLVPNVLPGPMTVHAPEDMYCAIGKDGQYLCVVPSMDLVMIRMGENPEQVPVPFLFLNDIWEVLNKIFT